MKKLKSPLHKIYLLFSIGILLIPDHHLMAQMPSTDIFVSEIKTGKDGMYEFSKPVNITNREGYDNQPLFFSGTKVYYTSLTDSSGTDIYLYDPVKGSRIRITKTHESEYSPTLMVRNKSLSVVRVDADSAQRLYQITLEGKSPRLLLKEQDSIGYHCWMNDHTLALFILGEPPTLQIAELKSSETETIASAIGRCIARIPGTENISYVDKTAKNEWYIKAYFPETKKSAFLIKTLEGSEDYAWTPDKKLLMGKDGKLFLCDPYTGKDWKEIADFSLTVGSFYRVTLNENGSRIAMVSYQGKKP